MAEEPIAPAAAPQPPASAAPVAVPLAAPAPQPAAAPVAPAAEIVAAAPEAKPPAAAEASAKPGEKPADGAAKPHTATPTLLEGAAKPGEKPAEAKPGEKPAAEAKPGEKPAEAKPAEAPKPGEKPAAEAPKPPEAAAPVYELKLPEGIKAEPEAMGALSALFGESKLPPETAQKIVDVGTKAMQNYATHLASEQHRIFGETRAGWVKEVLADPALGGAGHKTAMAAIARMRDLFVPADQVQAFNDFLRVTGAGDHPAFLRMLHSAARFYDEPGLPPTNPKPPPNNGRAPGKRGLREIYGQNRAARSG